MNEQAPALRVGYWIDEDGEERPPVSLRDLGEGYKVIYCFQHWCPGCHSHGFPSLKYMVDNLPVNRVGFAAVQTVFEGGEENTQARIRETQLKYGLKIPFGHDYVAGKRPTIMTDYQTGGTPWFIIIDPQGRQVFGDFSINAAEFVHAINTQEDN
jgi:thiol-disulfide isomerase/thioredoxin